MVRVQEKSTKIVTVVVVAFIGALLLGAVLPVGIDAMVGDELTEINQTEDTTYTVKTNVLDTNATRINTSTNEVDVKLIFEDNTTKTKTISEGNSKNFTFDGEDVKATVDTIHDDTHATLTYEYATSLGWPSAVGTIFSSLVYFVILLPLGAISAVLVDMF